MLVCSLMTSTQETASPSVSPTAGRGARKLIRAAERDPWNRLHSIVADAGFITALSETIPDFPVVPNLRCGAWYVPFADTEKGCYFKSTDGHTHEWNFSLKRPNLRVAQTCIDRGGAILVDSTRRGKLMPDALSKTVPVWCAVLNEASRKIYGQPLQGELHLYARMVSKSEASQIEQRLDGWVKALISSDLPVPNLPRPLVPHFITPIDTPSSMAAFREAQRDVLHVFCVSASRSTPTPDITTAERWVYIQGAGDDEEGWAKGLTPAAFWRHKENILAHRETCAAVIERIVEQEKQNGRMGMALTSKGPLSDSHSRIPGTPLMLKLGVSSVSEDQAKAFALVVDCEAPVPGFQELELLSRESFVLKLGLVAGKGGLREFRAKLPSVIDFITSALLKQGADGKPVLITGGLGSDLPGAVAVAVLSASFDESRALIRHAANSTVSQEALEQHRARLCKEDTKRRLQWLIASVPQASPSRAHLLRVNEVLLSPRYRAAAKESNVPVGGNEV